MNIWGPSMHSPPRGQAVGDGWGTMFALPFVKGKFRRPVHVVEEALAEAARAKCFRSFPDQARARRLALTSSRVHLIFKRGLKAQGSD
eukprot:53592-Pyramimonas_sp.AAC.1